MAHGLRWLVFAVLALSDARRASRRSIAEEFPEHSSVAVKLQDTQPGFDGWKQTKDSRKPNSLNIEVEFGGAVHVLVLTRANVIHDRYVEYHVDTRELARSLNGSVPTAELRDAATVIRERVPAGVSEANAARHRRSVNSKLAELDCFYQGTVLGVDGSSVAVSGCDLPDTVHAAIFMPEDHSVGSFEVVPTDSGEHVAYFMKSQASGAFAEGSCGVLDGVDHPGAVKPDPIRVDAILTDTADNNTGGRDRRSKRRKRSRRQACTKTVEVIILNDNSLYNRFDDSTEIFSTQIFNAMVGFYAAGNFNCDIQLSLVGQLTFRHGNPNEIIEKNCNLWWYYAGFPTAADNDCCAQASVCGCESGTDVTCLVREGACASVNNSVRNYNCHSFSTSWSTCGNRRRFRIQQQPDGDGGCTASSTASHEVDVYLLLQKVEEWIEANKVGLEALFDGSFDNVLYFSGHDFASGTVGLASIGSMCDSIPAHSINMIRTLSAMRNAIVASHELGHNFGLYHQNSDASAIMYPSSGANSDGHWASSSVSAINNLVTVNSLDCLNGPDEQREQSRRFSICGNGVVEVGEDCDPGLGIEDACCSDVCEYESGCACANTDGCCDNGAISAAGTVCRASLNAACDTAETCDGSSSECPSNEYQLAGTNCGTAGACYEGDCHEPLGDGDCPADQPSFCDHLREDCEEWCTDGNGFCYTARIYAPDGTPCGDGMQCSGSAFVQTGQRCVSSDVLNQDSPTMAPVIVPTRAPAPPTTAVPTTLSPTTAQIFCEDAAHTPFTLGETQNAECPLMQPFCGHSTFGAVITRLCPETCICPAQCDDFDGGTGYNDRTTQQPIMCDEMNVYGITCDEVGMIQRCTRTCGACADVVRSPTASPTDDVCSVGCRRGNRPA